MIKKRKLFCSLFFLLVFIIFIHNTSADTTITVASPGNQSYTVAIYNTTFPYTQNPIDENGSWLNGQKDGIDWYNGQTDNSRVHGASNGGGGYTDPTIVLNNTAWGKNQTVIATAYCTPSDQSSDEVEIRLHSNITSHNINGYEMLWSCVDNYNQMVRWNGPLADFSLITEGSSGAATGDVLKATIFGNNITTYKNGVQQLTGTDSNFQGGNPGLGFNYGVGANYANFGFTDFYATDMYIPLKFAYTNTSPLSSCWYAIDGGSAVMLASCRNSTLTYGYNYGQHSIIYYSNNTTGTTFQSSTVFFTFSNGQSPSAPTSALNTPADNYNTTSSTIAFNATGTASSLANLSIYGNWTGSWTLNTTNSSPISGAQTTFIISSLPQGKYRWNVYACDSTDNCTFASSNRTFTINFPGDLNNDNKVDSSDLLIIIKYILGIDQSNNVADVNGNGAVNIFDLVTTANLFGKQYGSDSIAPSIINSTPTNNTAYAAGTTQVPVFIETNERATCKYANFSSGNFTVNMTNFTKTGGISHTVTLTGLQDATNYEYYIKCQDEAGNLNNTNYMINFSIENSSSQLSTVINDGFESGNLNNWLNDGGGAIMSTDAHSGTYSANYDPNRGDPGSDHFGVIDVSPTFREAYLRMWIKFEGDIPAENGGMAGAHFWRFISWLGQSGGFGAQLDMNMYDQVYYLLYYTGGDIEKSYTSLFQKNVWQKHVFRIKLDTNQYVYQVDGQNMVNEQNTTDFNAGWTGGFDTWIFTNYDQGTGGDWLVDDVLLVTGPGAYNYTDTG